MKRVNLIAFAIIFLIAFLSVLYKVIYVPITHDEVATVVHYFNFSAWKIMMYPDNWPNNHILNTLLTKLCIVLFGKEQWAVRLPNLLSFIVFAWAAFSIIRLLFRKDSALIIAAIFLFFGNPYLLDFFSLCRGYGMSVALATISVAFLIQGYVSGSGAKIWMAFLMSVLASYANFTLLDFWVAITGLCALYFLVKYWPRPVQIVRHIGSLVILSVGYFALIFTPLKKMTISNQFAEWLSNDFYHGTVYSLVQAWRYNDGIPLGLSRDTVIAIVFIALGISIFIIIWRFITTGWNRENLKRPLTIAFLSLCLTTVVSNMQCWILKTPNFSDRTALFFFPLFSILAVSLLAEFDNLKIKGVRLFLAIIIPVIFTWNMIHTFTPDRVREWSYDESTLDVLAFLKEYHTNSKKKITLKTKWIYHPSFYFYSYTGKTPWLNLYPYDKKIDKTTNAEFYYILDSDLDQVTPEFKLVKCFGQRGLLVMRF